jgi:hypothetical protein
MRSAAALVLVLIAAIGVLTTPPTMLAAPVEAIRPSTTAEADALRDSLIHFIWAGGLPTRLPDDVAMDVQASAWLPMTNLARVDRLFIAQPGGIDALPLVFWPTAFNGRAFIYHGGHEALDGVPRNIANVRRLVAEGYVVLVLDMPLFGPNPTAGLDWHGDLFAIDTPSRHALAWFLEPVAVGVTYLRAAVPGVTVAMTGYSGGGWTTVWAAALDTRISRSYPVAGSLPLPLRTPPECGDPEQFAVEVYGPSPCDGTGGPGWLTYSELYALGAQRRASVQINNLYDTCCFWGDRREQYVPQVQAALLNIGGGSFESHVDGTHPNHEISPSVLEAMIRHEQGQPFVIVGATITPTPTLPPTPTFTPIPTQPPLDMSPYYTPTPYIYNGSCSPRPPIALNGAMTDAEIAVTVSAHTPISVITFGPIRNATVSPVVYDGTRAVFRVTRRAGEYFVPFTVTDGCGPVQKFWGQGGG